MLFADSPDPFPSSIPDLPPGDYGAAFVKMFLTLIALILLLFGTFWFLRRLIRGRLQRGSGVQAIQILEKKMLSQKSMLYWIEVEGKKVLISESHLEIRRLEGADVPRQPEQQ